MFKSKVDFNAFDLKNNKVRNLELTKAKNLSKNGVKKILANPNKKTSFHLILDYFKGEDGKPLEHLICFGMNKKLDKHFLQVEMKPSKTDQSMSCNPKEASMGVAYGKEQNGTTVLCLEPIAECKVPKGKWAKIIKELKPFLAGAKAILVSKNEERTETISSEKNDSSSVVEQKLEQVTVALERLEAIVPEGKYNKEKTDVVLERLRVVLEQQKKLGEKGQQDKVNALVARLEKIENQIKTNNATRLTPEVRQKVKKNLQAFEVEVTSIMKELQIEI